MKKQVLNCAIALICINTIFINGSMASCGTPVGTSVGAISTTSAVVEWMPVPGATRYNVQYHKDGTNIWENGASPTNSLSLTGLNAGTAYHWRVQTDCQGSLSAFTEINKFSTQHPAIAAPSGAMANTVTASSAMLSWTATPGTCNYYTVQWKLANAANWTTSNVILSPSFNLTGLASCSNYQFRVRILCSNGNSVYSSVASFTTVGCPVQNNGSPGLNRTTSHENENILQVSLYPNPVRDNLKIEYTSTGSGIVTTNIYNLIGNNLLSVKNTVDEGNNTFNLDTSELPEGIYLFELENNGEVVRSKFMISK